jgi:hypothetical protein
MEMIDYQILALQNELEAIRMNRKEADYSFQLEAQQWVDKQEELQSKLANRQCCTFKYLHAFDADSTPSSVVFKQAKLCSYLHNIEANKLQMKLMASYVCEATSHLHKLKYRLDEESSETQIRMLNGIARAQLEMSRIREAMATAARLMAVSAPAEKDKNEKRFSFRSVISELQSTIYSAGESDNELQGEKSEEKPNPLFEVAKNLWGSKEFGCHDFSQVPILEPKISNPTARVA